MKDFLRSLIKHPGVPVVITLQVMGFLAGMFRRGIEDNLFYALISAGAMSVFWIPVIWTAWLDRKSTIE